MASVANGFGHHASDDVRVDGPPATGRARSRHSTSATFHRSATLRGSRGSECSTERTRSSRTNTAPKDDARTHARAETGTHAVGPGTPARRNPVGRRSCGATVATRCVYGRYRIADSAGRGSIFLQRSGQRQCVVDANISVRPADDRGSLTARASGGGGAWQWPAGCASDFSTVAPNSR